MNCWSHKSLTIGEAAAFNHERHPMFAFSSRCGPMQRAILDATIHRLIGAVMTGTIRTIELYDPSNKTEITRDTAVITKDVLTFLGKNSGQQVTGSEAIINRDTKKQTHISKSLDILNEAASRFWLNADPNERDTHPKNYKIADWLKSQGFSDISAKQGAVIIRPDWAAKGRR